MALIKILEKEYDSLAVERNKELAYIGMVLTRIKNGIEVHMDHYTKEMFKEYLELRRHL